MKVEFEAISNDARIWIYQAAQQFTAEQRTIIANDLEHFTSIWDSHGAPLQAAYQIIDDQFIAIAVDEGFNAASGCSIDKSVAVIKSLEEKTGLSLLEKSNVAYTNGQDIHTVDFRTIKEKIETGDITPETKIYDITITSMDNFRAEWPKNAKDTWVKRFFGVNSLA